MTTPTARILATIQALVDCLADHPTPRIAAELHVQRLALLRERHMEGQRRKQR